MRILYIVTAFPRGPGDIITPWLIETIERLRERGIEVEVLAPSYRGLGDQDLNGIRVHRFRYAPGRIETLTHDQTAPDRIRERPHYLGLLPGYLLAGTIAATRLARTGRFDAVHAFWPLPHGLFGLAARRFAGVPLVSTFFGVELTWLRSQLRILTPLVRRIIRDSDAVTVISSHTAAEVRRIAATAEVTTIPFGAAVEAAEGRRKPGSEIGGSGAYRILFVGRLVERKGVDVLLRALVELRDDRGVWLTIVGDGPLRGQLERLTRELDLSDRVEFRGFVQNDELGALYDESNLFVLPAIRDSKGDVEGLGVVLIEALLHGLPVLASRSGGIPDIVRDGETGLLTEPGDAMGIAAAIRKLKADPGLARDLAEGGRRHVADRFSWVRIIDDLVKLYRTVGERTERARSGRAA